MADALEATAEDTGRVGLGGEVRAAGAGPWRAASLGRADVVRGSGGTPRPEVFVTRKHLHGDPQRDSLDGGPSTETRNVTPSTEVLNVRASERRSAARPCGEGGGPARHDRAFGGRVSGLAFGEPVACRLVLPGGRCPRRVAGSPNRIVIAESSGGSHRACRLRPRRRRGGSPRSRRPCRRRS